MHTQVLSKKLLGKDRNTDFVVIDLPEVLTIRALEEKLNEFFSENGSLVNNLLLNMRQCYFVEITSLMHIISLLCDRKRNGLNTKISLPSLKDVRDFMRIWQFPKAVFEATNLTFREIVMKDDHIYFGENKGPKDIKYSGQILSDGMGQLLSNRFFSFMSKKMSESESATKTVVVESTRWKDDLVKSVMNKHLSGPERYIPSMIIYESMSNACRHPNCSLILIVSHFEADSKAYTITKDSKSSLQHFTICLWDDGESMLETLKRPLIEGNSIQADKKIMLVQKFLIKYIDFENKNIEKIIAADFLPDKNTEDYLILFATTLPGITRDPLGKGQIVNKDIKDSKPELTTPGMGLSVLLNAAIDIFGGSVAFRTNRFFMNIRATNKHEKKRTSAEYRIKIQQYKDSLPSFLGNMLTIRLPIKQVNR